MNPKIILLVLSLCLGQGLNAQSQDSFNILTLVYQLPPLEILIDSAIANSRDMKARTALLDMKEADLKKMRYDYLDMVSFQAGTSYGNAALSTMQTGFSDVVLSNNSNARFSVGVNFSFSPAFWAKRKYERQIKRSQIVYEKSVGENAILQLRMAVIEAYLNLEYYRDAYALSNAAYETNAATVLLAEKKFLEGDIGIDIYNTIQLKHSKMSLEIEDYKRNLKQAFYRLEAAVGQPLHIYAK